MKKKPTSKMESVLRERFENAHLEASGEQEYRELRRQIKKEMKGLERKKAKKETEKALKDYLEGDAV